MAFKIIKPGLFTTIQDLGRAGYRARGVGPGGAMDVCAASIANWLVGNDERYPVIEMHFPGPGIIFEEDARISICGADFDAHINENPLQLWKPHLVKRGATLFFNKFISGARAYLAIFGRIESEKWLGSYSTHTKVKAGGYNGRVFMKDDIIDVNGKIPGITNRHLSLGVMIQSMHHLPNKIRCIEGPEWNWLAGNSKKQFTHSPFPISNQSDRMGYRLEGVQLIQEIKSSLISSPVDMGTVQLLPDGQCIILMADHQTTGGYPRIANVISADLSKLAQLPAGNKIQFELIVIKEAEESLISMQQNMQSIKNRCMQLYDKH